MSDTSTTDSGDGKQKEERHGSDPYGDRLVPDASLEREGALIPAATVVLLREGTGGIETLMLRKNKEIHFGGMWVFPGGRIDPGDHLQTRNQSQPKFAFDTEQSIAAARNAAARETREEAGLSLDPESFVWFSRWTPPPVHKKRFITWFFAAPVSGREHVVIDEGEIHDYRWIEPGEALELHRKRQMDFVPPTWMSLYYLNQRSGLAEVLSHFRAAEPKIYETHVGKDRAGHRVVMWPGDAGYRDWDATAEGARHRIVMAKDGFVFENSVAPY